MQSLFCVQSCGLQHVQPEVQTVAVYSIQDIRTPIDPEAKRIRYIAVELSNLRVLFLQGTRCMILRRLLLEF